MVISSVLLGSIWSIILPTSFKGPHWCGGNRKTRDLFVLFHEDVIKWKHFPRYWPFVRGIHRSPVNSPHKGQWRGALMFSSICAWINDWVNNREAGDLRRHYGVIVMLFHSNHCEFTIFFKLKLEYSKPRRNQFRHALIRNSIHVLLLSKGNILFGILFGEQRIYCKIELRKQDLRIYDRNDQD